ncbi:MAG TPA: DUF302 domain-containing protein [Bacillota bacterium]|nr:DUF302 domain-containing protein [Bacillota bacterium]
MDITFSLVTEKTLEQAVADLKLALPKVGFGVLWELSFKQKLQEKGVDFSGEFHVLEVCNPHEAKRVLEEEIEIGFFLPCKMAIYVKDGQTRIGMPKPTALMSMIGNDKLLTIAQGVEDSLKQAIEAAI